MTTVNVRVVVTLAGVDGKSNWGKAHMEGLVASKALILDMAHDCKRSCHSHTVPHIFTAISHIFTLFHTFHTLSHIVVSHIFTLFTHTHTAIKNILTMKTKIFVATNMYPFANFKREMELVGIG